MMAPPALRETLKHWFWSGCRASGANAVLRRLHRRQLLVLCYHGVVSTPPADRTGYDNTVSVEEFAQHLAALRQWFTPVSAGQVQQWVGGESLPERPVLVTFDDGYRNNLTLAAPLLQQHAVPALVFLTTGYIGTTRRLWTDEVVGRLLAWPEEHVVSPLTGQRTPLPQAAEPRRLCATQLREECKLIPEEQRLAFLEMLRAGSALDGAASDQERAAFLTWEEVRTLGAYGIEAGSHTVEHPVLSRLSREQLAAELVESKRTIERETGRECPALAYPFGAPAHLSPEVLAQAEAAGYRMAFTVSEQFVSSAGDRFALPRMGIAGHLPQGRFEVQVSGVQAALRRSSR